MKFTITPENKTTAEQYFKTGQTVLKTQPFKSNIHGLYLCLQDANGISVKVPIHETNIITEKNISKYGYVWFEYTSTDKEYNVEVTIS
ncbi:MAG TPA: hypothetical protein VN698_07710 [Bacteroidia bacterium]|nr:hypothetical protein [Bacteroidia bacterium]